ncbi:MAG TPA: JAB domain-containing protein [Sediminibacterium sp.]|jgi:DNA repair protein RadC|uniref:JAB domain-containing protein n=1 Tax=unclassified Sediminibacterium TaxID=2635961 RepID=UPI0008B9E6F9|nr:MULTISPECIES: JAB domain-containing protein [unclassified Sediminibacterium]OHC85220.1 MAG: DNA repair protein [Sphingobacteriia bacterium RIFOXYC2_FULL_35_18]OHC89126.1 MAG: DNA repair protein [Sphingobacteriia bacterium RIFOXYD2_FULL_35_12]OYZ03090.1 MAG: DNA repair protein [Sphingobacteriia bacterium 28-36-52]MBW0162708.1 JAB domain-containing protein [Sediminibacterium sp.]MBW0164171.1 JAB domain-containing protein [Sediminibacterium sp.]
MQPSENNWNMVSEIELVYRSKIKATQRPLLRSSNDVFEFLLQHWNHDKIELIENAKAIFLNTACNVLGLLDISMGGTTSTIVDPKIVFLPAIKLNANRIILAHNHPSGRVNPSANDLLFTENICKAGMLLEIKIMDHMIISKDTYYSFADEGKI